jgi:hypothetical protein
MTAGMEADSQLKKVIERIEAGLKEDPRKEKAGGMEGPRDWLFTKRVVEWASKLTPNPSESLLIAAWGHDLHRWRISRESYPMNTVGYHKWRTAQSKLSADETEKILKEVGYDEKTIARVRELILKTTFPEDPESRVLEDADCLAFLETKFESYLDEWDEPKVIRILKGTLEKMTPAAKELAKTIPYSDKALRLIEKALT